MNNIENPFTEEQVEVDMAYLTLIKKKQELENELKAIKIALRCFSTGDEKNDRNAEEKVETTRKEAEKH